MSEFWLRILGITDGRIPDGSHTEWELSHAPTQWMWIPLIALIVAGVYGVMWLYRREIDTCPPGAKRLLALVRAAVLLLLALVLLGPALAVSQRRIVQPFLIVLLDDSLSMSIKDRYLDTESMFHVVKAMDWTEDNVRLRNPSRAEVVNQVLARDNAKILRQLSEHARVRVFTFSNKVTIRQTHERRTAPDEAKAAPDKPVSVEPVMPSGPGTNLSKAIRESLRNLEGSPVAGIVIISDGQNTEGDDPLSAADAAGAQNVPLFTIGVGDPGKPRNLRVADIWARESVWRDDPFTVEASIKFDGIAETAVKVDLTAKPVSEDGTDDGAEMVVASRNLTLSPGKDQENVNFLHRPTKAGRYIYSVKVEPLPNELIETDNAKSISINVLSDKAKVLLIAGAPTWDYQLVRAVLQRDRTIDLSCWQQSMDLDVAQDGNTPISRLPERAEDLFKYDVIFMFDPNPRPYYNSNEYSTQWMDLLKRFVSETSGGFLYMPGPSYSGSFLSDPVTSAVRDLIPVTLGDANEIRIQDVQQQTMTFLTELPMRITANGIDHAITRFDNDPQINRLKWNIIPHHFWSLPTKRAKPGALVLLEQPGDISIPGGSRPLIAAGHYGSGRIAYIGIDGTWCWRRVGRDSEYFEKFWIQMVRYLIEGRRLGGQRRGMISLENDNYSLGNSIQISAKFYTPEFEPLAEPTVGAQLKGGGGAPVTIELRAIEGRPGQYEGSVIASQLGPNEISAVLPPGPDGLPVRIVRQFSVDLPRVEFANTSLNKAALYDMARRSGGKYFDIDQATELPAAIPDRTETIITRSKRADIWDTDRLIILLACLLTLEWALRKRYKLL